MPSVRLAEVRLPGPALPEGIDVSRIVRYLALEHDPGESFSIADFDFDADPQRLEYMARIYNSDNPDSMPFGGAAESC